MANPQPTDAHLRVAHSINEAIMMRDFTKRQRKILDLILRLSWGCGKKEACIPYQKDFMIVGIAESHISTELKWLQVSKIIIVEGQTYSFNKDFCQWQISRVRPFQPDRLTELVSLNLNNTYRIGKSLKDELPKTGSGDFPKQEVGTSQNSKLPTPNLASAKERGGEGRGKGPPHPIKERYIYITDFKFLNNLTKGLLPVLTEGCSTIKQLALYPDDWQVKAVDQAIKGYDPANWSIVFGILKNWAADGGPRETPLRPRRKGGKTIDPDKYIKGKYGNIVRR